MTVAYDGSGFCGWQAQTPPDAEPLRTVQGVLRDVLVHTFKQPIDLVGASRTDSGVHALGQVAHFEAETRMPLERMAKAINSRLPDDIEVRDVEAADSDFDAITDAVAKQYRYRLWRAARRPLHLRHVVWHCWVELDGDVMQQAAAQLVGEHDFAAFTNAGHGRLSTVRTICDCRVDYDVAGSDEWHVIVSGDGFLYNMVRIIVGTLVEIGRGRWPADYIQRLLSEPRRDLAGPTCPPQGLCLEWIKYLSERRT